ncbi:unnamed protein product, partial [Tetraodon nigroviridis]
MADTLRRLINTSPFGVLQGKLESWHRDYRILSCDQNLNKCCELIELTTSIQGQLFAILNITAAEGGDFDGLDTLKTRLLPWLGSCFALSRPSVTSDTSLQLIQVQYLNTVFSSTRWELSASHDSQMQKMDIELCSTRMQLDSVKAALQSAHEQLEMYKRKANSLDDYEQRIRQLREEFSCLSRSRSPASLSRVGRSSSSRRSESPTRAQLTNSSRHARLVSRFNDLYAAERLEAQALLHRYINHLETVQRIIFIAVVESFSAAKLAYRQFKLRTWKRLSPNHCGPESLEDASVDYIVRNLDLYDVKASVNDVIGAMNMNPQISFPPGVDFFLIGDLITETCKVAFAMQTLEPPLDISFASDGELYNESKYRRSYDSQFTAAVVKYHVWPALVEGDVVLIKGEAVTKRAALV